MGFCETSNFSIFTFSCAGDLKFAHILTATVSHGEVRIETFAKL